jgi:hypothetical protein
MVKRYYETVFVARHLSVRGRIRRDLIDVSPVAPENTQPLLETNATRHAWSARVVALFSQNIDSRYR